MNSTILTSNQNVLFTFPVHHCKPKSKFKTTHFGNLSFSPKCFLRSKSNWPLRDVYSSKVNKIEPHQSIFSPSFDQCNDANNALDIAKPVVYALFCIVLGLFCPVSGYQRPAFAAVVQPSTVVRRLFGWKTKTKEKKGHEYSHYTDKLLETVSHLLKTIEEARSSRQEDFENVQNALNEVKATKKALQDEIIKELHAEMNVLNSEMAELMKRLFPIQSKIIKAGTKRENLMRKAKGGDERIERLQEEIRRYENEYNGIWERIGEIEDSITRKETLALSIGVRELFFIERECKALVQGLVQGMRQRYIQSSPKGPVTKLPKVKIQEELRRAQRQFSELKVLPNALEHEDSGYLFDQDSTAFAHRIRQVLGESAEMQKNLETSIRKSMKKHGAEKRILAITPLDEVVKSFPDIELKWMFGKKEIIVPKAVALHLLQGWKKWREEVKVDVKKNLLENAELGKKYVAERQERVLLHRDRLDSKTWYNEEQNRWEMDPIAVPYAVSKKIVQNAIIRHDWAAMYITLKGIDKEYYVDIKEYDMLFEDFGRFDGLYLRMIATGIPTEVQLMWVPFSELDLRQQFLLIMRILYQCLNGLWNSSIVLHSKEWILKDIKNIYEDIMVMIGFPVLEFIIPYKVRMLLGMAWPEDADASVSSNWYLKWQSEAEMKFRLKRHGLRWYIWLLVRTVTYGYILFYVLQYMKKIPRVLGIGRLWGDPNLKKLHFLKAVLTLKKWMRLKTFLKIDIRERRDPIGAAFEKMKRVKNPPIRLKDFTSVDPMREEIDEVVAFLQNPRVFQEMGARAPRGVLIVGERDTGKTSLALAIAAEAKVPVVEVKVELFEGRFWVGQSASNIRELFQTARDLAPVILFVEDFDRFAGVRGKFIRTERQDQEALINQLLVELDGFEKQEGVVLMATTRNLKQIDEALLRPGRMDRIFHLQPPKQAEREKILRVAARETMDEDLIDFVDWTKVAEKTALLRPVGLKLVPLALECSAFRSKFVDADELMSYCSWFATFGGMVPRWVRETKVVKKLSNMVVNHLGLTLTREDLQNVVDLMEPYGQISNGIELLNPPFDWTRETKFPHAVWAAGSGLIALLLPNFDSVDNLWLEPCSWEGIAYTKITKVRNEGLQNGNEESRTYLEKKLVFCFGSYVASQLLLPFGEENLLCSSQLKQAQEIATRMVIQLGWRPDDSSTIYCYDDAVTALSMGDNFEFEMTTKVDQVYYLAYDKAKMMLQRNRVVLEKIVEELLQYEVLTRKDLERIMADNCGIREKEPFFLSDASIREPVLERLLDERSSEIALLNAIN